MPFMQTGTSAHRHIGIEGDLEQDFNDFFPADTDIQRRPNVNLELSGCAPHCHQRG
nr:hypothetical protein [Pseudomonas sp. FME51]